MASKEYIKLSKIYGINQKGPMFDYGNWIWNEAMKKKDFPDKEKALNDINVVNGPYDFQRAAYQGAEKMYDYLLNNKE